MKKWLAFLLAVITYVALHEGVHALVAVAFYVSAILVFTFRLLGNPQYGHWIGYFEFLLAAPLIFLLVKAPQ